jgi:hypothetical protein
MTSSEYRKTHFEDKITQIEYSPKPIELVLVQMCVGSGIVQGLTTSG